MAGLRLYPESGFPIVACSVSRIFHREGIQEGYPVSYIHRRHIGGFFCSEQICQIMILQFFSIINVPNKIFLICYPDQITGIFRIQLKNSFFFKICNSHTFLLAFLHFKYRMDASFPALPAIFYTSPPSSTFISNGSILIGIPLKSNSFAASSLLNRKVKRFPLPSRTVTSTRSGRFST